MQFFFAPTVRNQSVQLSAKIDVKYIENFNVHLFSGFIFPYKVNVFLENTLSKELIENYRDDLDFQNLIDLVQKDFECCGIGSEGYREWSQNAYFNCTAKREDNPSVERCGVPFSCCLKVRKIQNEFMMEQNYFKDFCPRAGLL